MEEARRRARRLELPKCRVFASDTARGGRVGDDFGADDRLLYLDSYSKERLIGFLQDAVLEHRWGEASGVCSALLRSLSLWSRSHKDTRQLFTMALEILEKIEPDEDNHTRYRKLFSLMYSHQPQTRHLEGKRLQGEVEFHLAIYLLSVGDWEGAYNTLRTIADGALRDDPGVNLTYGQVLHHLWYEQVCEEAGINDVSEGAGSFGDWQPETRSGDEAKAVGEEELVRDVDDASEESRNSTLAEVTRDKPLNRKRKNSEASEDDDFWPNARVEIQPIMDRRLFPVQIPYEQPNVEYIVPLSPRSKEFYDKAVEHLQRAIASAPEMLAALICLVQLLLATGDAEGANKEIQICYQATGHIIPLSLRILLLESLSEKDWNRMAQCYEEILSHNPSSVDAITGLIGLHEKGEYATESLIKAIATHLDVEPGSVHVWRKLADCFIEISSHINNDVGDISAEELVSVFLDRNWWITKHFPENLIAADESAKRWKMVTYKAACAAHIFGSSFSYVTKATYILKELDKKRFLDKLTSHQEQSLNLLAEGA